MARTTRSRLRWSPWDLDTLNDAFEVFQSRVALAPHLHQALVSDDLCAVKLDSELASSDEEGWEDEDAVSSRPATPLSRACSPLSDGSTPCSPSPLSDLTASPPSSPRLPAQLPSYK
ncbi:hypothetical protein B0H14DRAFT_3473401 [Mycena olivaceomarginata]|nr:hypothetical protein B0H14DRAFT_3473401 [Mycena olivaceomarginata]